MRRAPRTARAVDLYRRLLLAYPSDFRDEYGQEMALVFDELYQDAVRQRGLWRVVGLAMLWARTIADLVRSAPREHMDTILRDIRYAVRMMLSEPALTAVAVIALALGSGANTAIFSVVDGVLLKPLPYSEPDRIVRIEAENVAQQISHAPTSFQDYENWRDESSAFANIALYLVWISVLTDGAEPERIPVAFVSHNYFDTLGVRPIVGRAFTPVDDVPGAPSVAIVGESLWHRRYGGDPSVIGQPVRFARGDATIVGVVPDVFAPMLDDAQVMVPVGPVGAQNERGDRFLNVVGRLRPEATRQQADEELRAISARLETEFPTSNTGWSAGTVPLLASLTGDSRPALLVLLGAVAFVLLIACANVGNLLLARATARRREVALRTALGATRARIVRQFLTESLLLYVLGGAAGLAIAAAIVRMLVAYGPSNIPRLGEASLDLRALGFTFGVSLAVGLLFGLVPALRASRPDLADTLKESARGSSESVRRNRLRSALVVAQVALSLVLLVGAGLLIESFARVLAVDAGFNPEGAVVAQVAIPPRYDTPEKEIEMLDRLFVRLAALPGATSVAGAANLPLGGGGINTGNSFIREGEALVAENERQTLYVSVTPDYFRTLEIPILAGRGISADDRLESAPVVVVNQELARRYFTGEDPVGKRIVFWHGDEKMSEIVGVVRDIKHAGLDAPPEPMAYIPFAQRSANTMVIIARAENDPMALVPSIKAIVREVEPAMPVFRARPLAEVVTASVSGRRFQMSLLAAFAVVALVLASIGVYGVTAYSVARRTNEIGIRMALGASARGVTRMVVAQGVALALVGIAIGLVGAIALARVLESFLFGVTPTDPATLGTVSVLLAGVALLACFIPARRAARVDPVVALRHE